MVSLLFETKPRLSVGNKDTIERKGYNKSIILLTLGYNLIISHNTYLLVLV